MALIGHWPLNNTLEDWSKNKNVLTQVGTILLDNGFFQNSYKLTGVGNACFKTSIGTGINPTKGFSLSIWYKADIASGNRIIFGVGNGSNQRYYLSQHSGKWEFAIQNIAWNASHSKIAVVPNKWTHLVIKTKGNTTSLYVDGEFSHSKTHTSFSFATNFNIGNHGGTSNSETYQVRGNVQDARLYDHALTELEIKELAKGLVLHLPLDYGDGTKFLDRSGYRNHGFATSLSYKPTLTGNSPIGLSSFEFGPSDTITTDKIFYDDTNQTWTTMAWIYLNSNSLGGQYLNNFNLGNRIVHSGGNGKALLYINSGTNDAYTYSTGAIPEQKWVHIAFVLETKDQTCEFYLDGKLYGKSGNYSSTDEPKGFAATHIIGQTFQGKMSDFKIYSKALSQKEIEEERNNRFMVEENGTVYAKDYLGDVEPTINYYNLDVYERCWNGGSSNVCSLRTKTGPQSFTVKGKATTNPSSSGYAYIYPYYTVPVGKLFTFSCKVKNHHNNTTVVGMRLRDDNNGGNLSSTLSFNISAGEEKYIEVKSTSTNTATRITPAFSIYSDSNGEVDIEITEIQLEEGLKRKGYTESFKPELSVPLNIEFDDSSITKEGVANFKDFNTVGITDGMIGYWPLIKNSKEYSFFGDDGTDTDMTYDDGAIFNGTTSFIDLGVSPEPIKTWTFMMKAPFTSSTIVVFVNRDSEVGWGFHQSKFISKAGVSKRMAQKGSYSDTEWNHILVTYDNTGLPYVYINGVETTYNGSNTWTASTGEFKLGKRNSGNHFTGQIKNFKTFNRQLTLEEIKLEYNTMFNNEVQIHKDGILYAKDFKQF